MPLAPFIHMLIYFVVMLLILWVIVWGVETVMGVAIPRHIKAAIGLVVLLILVLYFLSYMGPMYFR